MRKMKKLRNISKTKTLGNGRIVKAVLAPAGTHNRSIDGLLSVHKKYEKRGGFSNRDLLVVKLKISWESAYPLIAAARVSDVSVSRKERIDKLQLKAYNKNKNYS